jgi:superfamily II DNA/RNA helicase
MTNIIKQRHVSDEFSQEITEKFSDLGISESILAILKRLNLEIPTPIQHKTIPIALTGQDLIGVAQTGTGKTFAFGIPMLQRLGLNKGQGLVIAPTRELALQVEESLKKLGQPLGLRTAILIGGEALDRQLFQLRKKPHIVVATPGRLIDHLKRRTYKLDQVNVLVLDEADMMLDMGFAPQIKEILDQTPKDRQTMLFSATMPVEIVRIAANYMKLPVSIEVAPPGSTVAKIDQEIFIIKSEDRFDHLLKVLDTYKGSVLVFVRTKHGVKALTQKLQSLGQRAVEIHSNLSLNRRRAALGDFKSKKERILVATDVAARGLDVQGIELVVNYNLPDSTGDYVHRIGRTGRAGQVGKAITFATSSEQREIWAIEKLINKEIKRTEFVKFAKPTSPSTTNANRPRVVSGTNAGRSGGRRFGSSQQFGTKQQFGSNRGTRTGGTRTSDVRAESKPFRSNSTHSTNGVQKSTSIQKSTSNRYGRPSARPFSRRGQFSVK